MSKDNQNLITKLEELKQQYNQLTEQLSDPSVSSDHNKFIAISKKQGQLRVIVQPYEEYLSADKDLIGAQEMLTTSDGDIEIQQMAKDEIELLTNQKSQLIEKLQNKLVMANDDAINSVIIEIRAGTGGDEASLFARNLFNMYSKYAEQKRWKLEQLDFSTTEMGGFREIIFNIKGVGVWSQLGYEGGGHRVQRVPQTESQGRVHTSAATVAVLPEPEEVDITIAANEVIEHVSRAGGPGGQSVNKTSSAIKLEHLPTGITVSMRDEKSQHKNRSKAWRILRSRVYDHFESKKRAERDSQRKTMIGSGDRSQKIRTYNYPQNRVTDHRINLSLYSLDKIIAGGMDELIEALQKNEIQQRIANL